MAFGLLFAMNTMEPKIPENAVSGTVACNANTKMIFAKPACFGAISVSGLRQSGRNKIVRLDHETRGNPNVIVVTNGKKIEVELPPRSRTGWQYCRSDYNKPTSLNGTTFEELGKQRSFSRYGVTEWGIRNGQPVVLDLERKELWCGTKSEIIRQQEKHGALAFKMFGGLGTFFALLGGFGFLFVWWGQKKRRESQPSETAPIEQWVEWTLRHRSGSWSGLHHGKEVKAQSIYRRRTSSTARLTVVCESKFDLTIIRRSGAIATVGRMIDSATNIQTRHGDASGYPDLEIAVSSRRGEALLADDNVRVAILSLFDNQQASETMTLSVRNDGVSLQLSHPEITTEKCLHLVETLNYVADSVARHQNA